MWRWQTRHHSAAVGEDPRPLLFEATEDPAPLDDVCWVTAGRLHEKEGERRLHKLERLLDLEHLTRVWLDDATPVHQEGRLNFAAVPDVQHEA